MRATRIWLSLVGGMALVSAPAQAITGVLCIKTTGKGAVKVRNPTCKPSEVQVGTFDTSSPQASLTPQDISVRVQLPNDLSKASGGLALAVPFGLGSETYDSGNLHDETTNPERLVAPITGKYLVYATVVWSPNASGWRMAHLTVNGNGADVYAFSTVVPVTAFDSGQVISTHLNLNAGDYVELFVQQNSGSSLDLYSFVTTLGMVKVP